MRTVLRRELRTQLQALPWSRQLVQAWCSCTAAAAACLPAGQQHPRDPATLPKGASLTYLPPATKSSAPASSGVTRYKAACSCRASSLQGPTSKVSSCIKQS